MNLSHPAFDLLGENESRVLGRLAVLADGTSGRRIHQLAGVGTLRTTQKILRRLVEIGLADVKPAGPGNLYSLNRDHVLWGPIQQMLETPATTEQHISRVLHQILESNMVGAALYGSFARGGLANGWGANALSFDDDDLRGWPLSFADMAPAYRTVCQRIPVAGPPEDDLSASLPGVHLSQPAVPLTSVDARLLQVYGRKKAALSRRGIGLGRARLAVVTDPADARACDGCDRCLWGCPRGSIYNPATSTLEACRLFPGFHYRSGREVLSLRSAFP